MELQGFARRRVDFRFTHDENGVWAGADFNLFMCMLIMNRSDLAHLFYTREGRQNAASMLPNALWACLLSRQLSNFEGVGTDSYHLKNCFQVDTPSFAQHLNALVSVTGFAPDIQRLQ